MSELKNTGFADRISAAAEAKRAMIARFQPKPMVTAAEPVDRAAQRLAEREAVRQQRIAEREAAKAAKAAAEEAARQAAREAEEMALGMKRSQLKERKALAKSDAQARRAARLAMYGR